jgi:hypothetical protein
MEQDFKREDNGMQMSLAQPTNALARPPKQSNFMVPRPGNDGAIGESLAGQTFVLTGLFPEVGGGAGLSLGKARVRQMIEDFGGRVTSAISGKTDYLVVGKEPGRSKVGKARAAGKCDLIEVGDLQGMVRGGAIGSGRELVIEDFSAGWHGNALRLGGADEEFVGGVKRLGAAGGGRGKKSKF